MLMTKYLERRIKEKEKKGERNNWINLTSLKRQKTRIYIYIYQYKCRKNILKPRRHGLR